MTLETEVERLRKFVGKTRQIVDQIGLMAEDRSKHPDVRLMAANAYGDLMHVYYELVLPPTLEGRA